MKANYPNLELMEYQSFITIKSTEELLKKFEDAKAKYGRFTRVDFAAEAFIQMWGNTNTAFDVCLDGSPTIGGCAMTEAYTVVMHERTTDVYFVFVDNKLCYYVENANQVFLTDLKEHNIKSLSEAKKAY